MTHAVSAKPCWSVLTAVPRQREPVDRERLAGAPAREQADRDDDRDDAAWTRMTIVAPRGLAAGRGGELGAKPIAHPTWTRNMTGTIRRARRG